MIAPAGDRISLLDKGAATVAAVAPAEVAADLVTNTVPKLSGVTSVMVTAFCTVAVASNSVGAADAEAAKPAKAATIAEANSFFWVVKVSLDMIISFSKVKLGRASSSEIKDDIACPKYSFG